MIVVGKIVVCNNDADTNTGDQNNVPEKVRNLFSSLKDDLLRFGIIREYIYYEEYNNLVLICEILDSWNPTIPNIDTRIDRLLADIKTTNFTISVSNISNTPLYETSPDWREEGSLILFPVRDIIPFPRVYPPLMGRKTRLYVPLPELQLPYNLLDDLQNFVNCCNTIHRLYINYHGFLEKKARYELSDPLSDLTRRGLDIADLIKEEVGLPVYYYLSYLPDNIPNDYCPLCKKNLFDNYDRGFYFCDICKFAIDYIR
ncbi:MAG: DUF2310 family Zn-ribbon-containing protein [Planctomycetaceae bacterium]|jgi:hypothetical protein|nr:DUF2310 family Zn-ribbon-containing protein [Planctomycetaceae bacterium]